MGIGGGKITRKLLFAVLLVSSLSLAGIAGASAADVGTAQTQSDNNITVQKKANIQVNDTDNVNKSATTQNSADGDIKTVKNAGTATSDASVNQTTVKAGAITQDTAITSANQTVMTPTVITTNVTSQNSSNTEINTKNAVSTADVNNQNSVTSTANNTTNTQTQKAAAGETKVTTNFTTSQINDAAARVKKYIETNHVLPKYVTIGTTQVQMPDFLKLLTKGLLQINSKTTTPVTIKTVNNAPKPVESIKNGKIYKSGYLDLAKRVNAFIDANGVLPNYANSDLGKLRPENLIYIYSKIFNYYKVNNVLPNYVTVKAWSTIATGNTGGTVSTPVPADLQIYLQATRNSQSNDPTIKALAARITSGKTSTYNKAAAVFNWVRDNLGYSFYYNTKYGAVGALKAKTGNCVDTSHLVVALARAAGLPARYAHGDVKFPSGNTYGHVWAQIWVNGKWYTADGTSSKNTFGTMVGTVVNFKGYHRELTF